MEFTEYFLTMRRRPDRAFIELDWIQRAIDSPVRETVRVDSRIRRWIPIQEMEGRYLRVILPSEAATVHNAFFDRTFRP